MAGNPPPHPPSASLFSSYEDLAFEIHANITRFVPGFDQFNLSRACQTTNQEPDKLAILRAYDYHSPTSPPPELAEFIAHAERHGLERRYVVAALNLPYEGRFACSVCFQCRTESYIPSDQLPTPNNPPALPSQKVPLEVVCSICIAKRDDGVWNPMIPNEMCFILCVRCKDYKEEWISDMDFYKEILASQLCHECHEASVRDFELAQEEQRQKAEEQRRKDDQLRRLQARRSRQAPAYRMVARVGRKLLRRATPLVRGGLSSSLRTWGRISSYAQCPRRSFEQYRAACLPVATSFLTEILGPIVKAPIVAAPARVYIKSEEGPESERLKLEQQVANRKHLAVLRAREARAKLEIKVFLAQVNGESVDPDELSSLTANQDV